ncbi:MAG: NYN domain-containing protein [Candidatus Berkelbacteria bacterium]|nr:NYN domain-containing protein [Candidatus Berkelbacteria bacterium]
MPKKQFPKIYAFIDSQNLNLGTRNDLFRGKKKIYSGWQLDFQKFRIYLKDKFRVSKAFIFIGKIKGNEELYKRLKSFEYELIFKPTTKDHEGKPKGNIDAELVLYSAAIEFPNYDKTVVVSGDGDFYCLYEYLVGKKKLLRIIIPNRLSESSLLREFHDYKTFLIRDKNKIIKERR